MGLDGGAAYPEAGSVSPLNYAAPVEDLDARRYPSGFVHPRLQAGRRRGLDPGRHQARHHRPDPGPGRNMVLAAHKPVKVTTLGPGRYLLDFGVTQVGGLRLTLDGTAGEKVRVLSGEVLSGPGSVRYKLSAGTPTTTPGRCAAAARPPVLGVPDVTLRGGHRGAAAAHRRERRRARPHLPRRARAVRREHEQRGAERRMAVHQEHHRGAQPQPLRRLSDPRAVQCLRGDNYVHQLAQAAVDGESAPRPVLPRVHPYRHGQGQGDHPGHRLRGARPRRRARASGARRATPRC